ncbi:MAG: bifunctional phosphoribosyl-AMP cyclohydrolase/phosphoribosyl-ATP diphosphatase HisIE [Candidatus Bathyarchaeia archaeon]
MVLKFDEPEAERVVRRIDFTKCGGLLPVVVQDDSNDSVLMQAFMNPESLRLTLTTGRAHYWSRTRRRIWMKGEASGHVQLVQGAFLDCDLDALLLRVQQKGVVCHTGKDTCFHNGIDSSHAPGLDGRVLNRVFEVIKHQMEEGGRDSYMHSLTSRGQELLLKKIGEESSELIIASMDGPQEKVVKEATDLLVHVMALLANKRIDISRVYKELDDRHREREKAT